jgi:hypothetical protein
MQVSDWAEGATAIGTLVLAVATFSSVRSGNRQGRNAERALNAGLRPVLFSSRLHETTQKIRWGDDHWAMLETGHAVLEEKDGVIYMAISLLNVGAGIAELQGWRVDTSRTIDPHSSFEDMQRTNSQIRPDPSAFRAQSRDLYSPPGELSFWQAAIRTPDDPDRSRMESALAGMGPILIDLLYSDQEGGQRTISRFSISRINVGGDAWYPSVVRHWFLDQEPRRRRRRWRLAD